MSCHHDAPVAVPVGVRSPARGHALRPSRTGSGRARAAQAGRRAHVRRRPLPDRTPRARAARRRLPTGPTHRRRPAPARTRAVRAGRHRVRARGVPARAGGDPAAGVARSEVLGGRDPLPPAALRRGARRVRRRREERRGRAARPRRRLRPRVERPRASAARGGDRGVPRAARPVAGAPAGTGGDALPRAHARRAESLQRRAAAPRELRHEVSTPQAGPGRAVPAGLGAREVGRHEGGARRPARVRRRGAQPRTGAGGAADDHRDAHALRRPERAAGHLQVADGADAADAGGALRRGLDRGPARPAERPGDGVAPPPEGVPRPPARHARRARPGQRRVQAQRVEGGRRAGQRRDAEQGGRHARRGTPAGRRVRTQARPLPRGREGVRRRRRREGRRGRGALPGARRPRARARAAQRPPRCPRGVRVGREQEPGRDAARLGARPRPGRQEPARPAARGPGQGRRQVMRRRGAGAIVLATLLVALPARAATLLPLVPPPPDLTALIPFAEAPLDKPPSGVGDLALPEGPTDLPSFPPATVVAPWGDKPTAAVAHPGKLACVGAFFGVASMALECGRERYTKAEYEDAAKALEQAVRGGSEKDLALASYALGRHEEAVAAWETLRSRGAPVVLARAVGFWLGESLGRVGQYDRAATELERFVTGGPHPLLDAGRLRLGWWSLAARRAKQSADAFRAYLTPSSPSAAPRTGTERDWAEAGLALALLNSDFDAAREAARSLESRRSPLREPLFLRFARTLVERKKGAEAQVFIQELLVANLTPAVRAWVLLLSGEASRAQGDLDDARTQYDLGRRADPATATGWLAGLRHAQVNFEMREFAQAARDLSGLVATAPSAEARALVLVLQAEAGYHAGQYAAAGAAFRRALVEFPSHPQAGAARLGVAWTALRQDRDDEARREFLEFVRLRPQDPQAPDALLLASELALKVPAEWNQAKVLLDRIIRDSPNRPRTEFAKFNRALLLLRAGDAKAQPELGDWIRRAPFPPLLGRAQAAMGAALLAAGFPSDAEKAFAQAQRQGLGAPATLGLAAAQFAQGKLDVAKGLFEDARDKGTPTIAHAPEYGLAAIAFQGRAHKEVKQPALAALGAAPKGRGAPRLLYVLAGIAVEEKDWTGALEFSKRLADEFPADEAADDVFESVGAGAVPVGAWPVVYEAYSELRRRYPQSPV